MEISMSSHQPDSLDRIIGQQRSTSGSAPKSLNDPSNYFVFDRVPSKEVDVNAPALDRRKGGYFTIDDPSTVLGIVLEAAKPVTPASIKVELSKAKSKNEKAASDNSSFVPKWLGVSPTPSMAPRSERMRLVRRNGKKVRPEWVIAPDDSRSAYYPNTWPFNLVGRIFVWDNASNPNWSWWGTASLLGTRTILTASHVVPWGSGNWKALFIPAFYDGASIYGAWAASWVTHAQGYSNHAQGDDMAVMRLDVPLGNNLGWFGFRTYDTDWEDLSVWTLPGYPWDKDGGNRPWLQMNFPIIDDDNDGAGVELEYLADTEGGQSGAPVFAWFNGSPDVVGTHSGGEDNFGEPRQNLAAGGEALTNLLHWARANWP
jgi:V8-like Glu-specific endopeptidase